MEPRSSPLGDTIARLRIAAPWAAARGWLPSRLHALIAAAFARIFDQLEQLLLLWKAGALPTPPTRTPVALTPPARTPVAHTAAPNPHAISARPIAKHPARARPITLAPCRRRTPAIHHPRARHPMPPACTIPRTSISASSARPRSARAPPLRHPPLRNPPPRHPPNRKKPPARGRRIATYLFRYRNYLAVYVLSDPLGSPRNDTNAGHRPAECDRNVQYPESWWPPVVRSVGTDQAEW